ncbi:MAG: DUF5668 domain-containing protein [bacterium]|nr:DUF5668 domain-containing protein [bacterium]
MMEGKRSSRIATGLLLVVIGALMLVENLTGWGYTIGDWWPALLVVIGLANLVRRRSGRWFWAAFTLLGALFLLDSLGVWAIDFGDVWRLWPLILVWMGARFILAGRRSRARRRKQDRVLEGMDTSELNVSCGFGTTEQRITSRAFSGGTVSAIFGSATIDLVDAGLAISAPTVDVSAVFGGVVFVVPDDWVVDLRTTNVFGGASDQRSETSPRTGPTLTITGTCLFGGITIESGPAGKRST